MASEAAILPAMSSAAFLSRAARRPRFALKRRLTSFHEAFEDRALFYDCFRHHDGRHILLVGPPPMNLDYRALVFEAGGERLAVRFHVSLSVSIAELPNVPTEVAEITVSSGDESFVLPVQPSRCGALAGRRLIFAINRDNELSWIREWAHWYARHHGADAAVVFDNGSSAYGPDEIAATLVETPGMGVVAVHSWPHRFGPFDPAVIKDPYWARFLQIASMSVVLRRYGMKAFGLLDCDIDELAMTRSGRSVFDLARQSRGGLVVFRGGWVEAVKEPGSAARPPHRAYRHVLDDARQAESRHRKWALDPSRPWVQRLKVHPYWHWIEGRARGVKTMSDDAAYWHFRAINTNWKRSPAPAPAGGLRREVSLDRAFEELGP